MKSLYILPLIFRLIISEDWSGCVTESNPSGLVKSDTETAICLSVGENVGDWASGVDVKRYTFAPIADDYSRFHIEGSWQDAKSNNLISNVTVFASSGQSLSFVRKYYDEGVGVFPYLTAIVDVQDGVVKGIAWDDASIFCGQDRSDENTFDFSGQEAKPKEPTKGCFLTRDECETLHAAGSSECDLTLYVVWTGTDSKGMYFKSSSRRFSAFSPKQIKDQLKDGIKKLVPDFNWGTIF